MVDNLQQWFSERPKWLQIAAERLFEKAVLKDEDIQELSSTCLQEVEGKLKQRVARFLLLTFLRILNVIFVYPQ